LIFKNDLNYRITPLRIKVDAHILFPRHAQILRSWW